MRLKFIENHSVQSFRYFRSVCSFGGTGSEPWTSMPREVTALSQRGKRFSDSESESLAGSVAVAVAGTSCLWEPVSDMTTAIFCPPVVFDESSKTRLLLELV